MTVPPAQSVPDALRAFIVGSIESVEACEVLLSLHAGSNRSWSAKEVSRALKLPLGAAQAHLETLARRGLLDVRLTSDLRYRLAPARTEVGALIALLGTLYRANPAVVADIVASKPAR